MIPYDEDYFMRGQETKKSCYTDYRWIPELTLPMARCLIDVLGIKAGQSLLDFGCARGYLVRAMRELGIAAYGYDISKWAIQNCDPAVKQFVGHDQINGQYDWLIAKDCFEHIPERNLAITLSKICTLQEGFLVIVPLSKEDDGDYVRHEDNLDATHELRWPLQRWMTFLQGCLGDDPNWELHGSWHINGLKPTSWSHYGSCGFIIGRRTEPC